MADPIFIGFAHLKFYQLTGLTSTVRDSFATSAIDTGPEAISWDGTNCCWAGAQAYKMYRTIGMTSSIVDSFSCATFAPLVFGIGWDGTTPQTYVTDVAADNLIALTGWSSTVSSSVSVNAIDAEPYGVTTNESLDPIWIGREAARVYHQDGISSTIEDSVSFGIVDNAPWGVTWTGAELLWAGDQTNFLFLMSGFTSTIQELVDISAIDGTPRDCTWSDYDARMANPALNVPMSLTIARELRRRRTADPVSWLLPYITADVLDLYLPPAMKVVPGIRRRRAALPVWMRAKITDIGHRYLSARGRYRVFNSPEYRLYRSNSAPPDESDSPFETTSSLPYETTATFADGTWYISMSHFNGVVDSGFLPLGPNGETYLLLKVASGADAGQPPQAPLSWWLHQEQGELFVRGLYWEPGAWRASYWKIAYGIGAAMPSEDTYDAQVGVSEDGLDYLNYSLGSFANGTVVNVRAQMYRALGGWSEDSYIQSVTIDTTGPSAIQQSASRIGELPSEFLSWPG